MIFGQADAVGMCSRNDVCSFRASKQASRTTITGLLIEYEKWLTK